MSKKIARITQDKKLLLANEVVEDNTKIKLNSDGRLDTDEIIEYPAELEGGRNLIENSDFVNEIENWTRNQNVSLSIVDKKLKVIFNQETSTPGVKTLKNLVLPTGTYTISAKVKGSYQGLKFTFYAGSSLPTKYIHLTGEWEVVTRTIDLIEPIDYQFMMLTSSPTLESYFLIDWVKFEKGNKATDWTPAPEDLGLNYPDSIQNFNSSISGNNIIVPEFIEGYPFVKPVIDDSLVLWLDGSTGNNYEKTNIWKDLSGNGNDGQLMNFDFTEDSGWGDGGLRFDGVDDWVEVDNVNWVEVDNVNTRNRNFTVEMICDIQSNGGYFAFKNQADRWSFLIQGHSPSYYRVRTWTWPDGVMVGTNYPLTPLENGTLCFRVLDRVLSVFMNGEKKQEIVLEEFDPFAKLIIGSYTGGGLNHISGIVNTFKLYNRALTDEEIFQNYRAGQCSPLLAMRGDVIG